MGSYIKVGNLVHVQGRIIANSLSGVTVGNIVKLHGLPFTSSNTSNNYSAGSMSYGEGLNITAGTNLALYPDTNTTVATISIWDAATGTTGLLASELSDNGGFIFSIQYNT